jgi:uncharacterized membrane protein
MDTLAMDLVAFVFDLIGQVEADLASPFGAFSDLINLHSTLGWTLAGVLSLLSGWRYEIRSRDSQLLPPAFLVAGAGPESADRGASPAE